MGLAVQWFFMRYGLTVTYSFFIFYFFLLPRIANTSKLLFTRYTTSLRSLPSSAKASDTCSLVTWYLPQPHPPPLLVVLLPSSLRRYRAVAYINFIYTFFVSLTGRRRPARAGSLVPVGGHPLFPGTFPPTGTRSIPALALERLPVRFTKNK